MAFIPIFLSESTKSPCTWLQTAPHAIQGHLNSKIVSLRTLPWPFLSHSLSFIIFPNPSSHMHKIIKDLLKNKAKRRKTLKALHACIPPLLYGQPVAFLARAHWPWPPSIKPNLFTTKLHTSAIYINLSYILLHFYIDDQHLYLSSTCNQQI